MIEPTSISFLSPRERIRTLAAQVQLLPSYNLEPPSLSSRHEPVNSAIKAYFLSQGHDLASWQAVSNNLQEFNCVWCAMLGIKYENAPPAPVWRFEIPSIK